MTESRESKSNAPALDKGLDILEFMAGQETPQSIYDISRGLGRTRGEVYRMLDRLIDRGYLARVDSTEKVLLSDKTFSLAVHQNSTQNLIMAATPFMSAIHRITGNSSTLMVQSGSHCVSIHNFISETRIALFSPIGSRARLWEVAPGLAMLGSMPNYEAESILKDQDQADRADIDRLISLQQDKGYSLLDCGDVLLPGREVAVPFEPFQRHGRASISVILHSSRAADSAKVGEVLVEQCR